MSEKLCTLRTKGGGGGAKQTETVLWTNPSPDSNFAGQTITLSESIDNFDYIKVTAKKAYNNSTFYTAFIVTPENFKKTLSSLGSDRVEISFTIAGDYTRRVLYVDNTSVNFSLAYKLGASGTSQSYAIPLEILGLNELDTQGERPASIEPNTNNLLGQITTVNGSYTATEDCIMCGMIKNSGGDKGAQININGYPALIAYHASTGNACAYVGNVTVANSKVGMYIPRGSVVTSSNIGTYSIKFYSINIS